jgi:hypothetical protein
MQAGNTTRRDPILALALAVVAGMAHAGTKTWDGGGSDDLASTAANWSDDTVPTPNDHVRLDATSTKNMVWDSPTNGLPATVASWSQTADYTGDVTFLTTYASYSPAFTLFTVTGDAELQGGSWTHLANVNQHAGAPDAKKSHWLDVAVGGTLTVGSNAIVHARNKGFKPGNPLTNGGAPHGGAGAGTDAKTSAVYGSALAPLLPGTGCLTTGGSGNTNGGGAIRLTVAGATRIDGLVDASGIYNGGSYCRAAAGGSVLLTAGALSGAGSIRARGMDTGGGSNTGNGGGGRVAVVLTDPGAGFANFDTTKIDAAAGTGGAYYQNYGSAGSVYLRGGDQTSAQGTIVVDFVDRYGDLIDDKVHRLMAGDIASGCDLVLRRQALFGFASTTETRTFVSITADATSHVKFSGAANKLTCEQLTVAGKGCVKGTYTAADLPDFLAGPGSVEVTVGAPRGMAILVR